jgi:F0F1-type ATP synthase delta subunit
MKAHYVKAFIETVRAGMPLETALSGLKAALARKKHEKLFASILLESLRVLEAQKAVDQAVVAVAKNADAISLATQIKAVLAELGVKESTEIKEVVDETLIGGFVATFDHKEHDRSYKKALKSLYESITK